MHEANRRFWNAASAGWKAMHDARGTWKLCHKDPSLVLITREMELLAGVAGKSVCVLGSGDNLAVFALAGMGASVTSVDISENQLAAAEERAKALGLNVSFLRSDVTELSRLSDESFDVVYTGGHVAVWVSDIDRYYAEAARILKPAGLFIVNEYHPFRRVWKESADSLEVEAAYFDKGPFLYNTASNVLDSASEAPVQYEFHWTIGDMCRAVLKAGCVIIDIFEHGTGVADWEAAPMNGLPEYLLIAARKKPDTV